MNSARADISLMARMLIDEAELAHRKELLSFTETDVSFLMLGGPFIMTRIEDIIDDFYRVQLAIPEVSAIIPRSLSPRKSVPNLPDTLPTDIGSAILRLHPLKTAACSAYASTCSS